jgi:branched-chain amino acid transport system substrate-binding protein
MSTRHSRGHVAVVVLIALSAIAAACGDKASSSADHSTTTVDLSVLGTPKPAKGTPLKIGWISDGGGAATDGPGEKAATGAAVKYVNEYLGGVQGRPIELVWCETALTPAGATDCANQMVTAKVPIVLASTPGVADPIVKVLTEAKIPFLVHTAVDQSVVLSADAYVLTNVLGFLATPVKIAKDKGYKKVATLIIDLPVSVGPVKAIEQPLYDKAGIAVDYTAVPPGTPDMTPQVQAAASKNPDMFVIIGDPTFCTAGLSALKTVGFKGTIFINQQCMSPDLAKSVPGGTKDVLVGTAQALAAGEDHESKLYTAVMAKYAPGVAPFQTIRPNAYAAVLGFARAMSGSTGEVTPDSVRATFASAQPQPMPLLSGETFKCDGTLFKLTPAVCSTGMAVATLDADGNVVKMEPVDTRDMVNG